MEKSKSTAFGFVAASPDTDYAATVRGLAGQFPAALLGGTSIGDPFDTSGEPFGTSVAFVEREGVRCGMALSEPVSVTENGGGGGAGIIRKLLDSALERLGGEPKLYLVFMPVTADYCADSLMDALHAAAGGVPVFGAMVSDDLHSDRSAVFFGGECHSDRIALAALGGDIHPVFAVGLEMTFPTAPSPVVTDADGTRIRAVDGVRFADFLGKFGIDGAAIDDYPVSFRLRRADGDGQTVITDLMKMEDDGSGIVSNTVRNGDVISLCYLTRDNVEASAKDALRKLNTAMEAEKKASGAVFDTVLAVSCVTRYYVLAGGKGSVEADALREMLPEGMSTFGMFAFSEYCPAAAGNGGERRNAVHGQTLALCAF